MAIDQDTIILEKLDTIIGFLAVRGVTDETKVSERLFNLGIADRAIAKVMGITDNAVSIRKSRLKKKQPKVKALNPEIGSPDATATDDT